MVMMMITSNFQPVITCTLFQHELREIIKLNSTFWDKETWKKNMQFFRKVVYWLSYFVAFRWLLWKSELLCPNWAHERESQPGCLYRWGGNKVIGWQANTKRGSVGRCGTRESQKAQMENVEQSRAASAFSAPRSFNWLHTNARRLDDQKVH